VDKGTKWSDLRRKHGIADPHKVTHWCLGNEMDGPWQIGHMSAVEYGEKAADAARQMRYVDPSLKLIACGSSGPTMPTYLEWDREVLEQCYDYVDAISLHRYFDNTSETGGGDTGKFLALNLSMERQITEVAAVCEYVRGRKRSPKSSGCPSTNGMSGTVPAAALPWTATARKLRTCSRKCTTSKTHSWLAA